MHPFRLLIPALSAAIAIPALAQVPAAPPRPATRNVEPGLEKAAKWKWQAVPSASPVWGETPEIDYTSNPMAPPTPTATPDLSSGRTYEVKSGDRLVFIARKFGITVEQLKGFNQLSSDFIRVGQILNIPTIEQAIAIAPMPTPKATPAKKKTELAPGGYDMEELILQVFLDRDNFSPGSISGRSSPTSRRVAQLYLLAHPEIPDPATLQKQARSSVGEVFTSYVLRPEDFRFIVPPRVQRAESDEANPGLPGFNGGSAYQRLIAAPMLAYRTPWEFVAERFHCDEAFLHAINQQITTVPQPGTEFRVPKVKPFVIESCLLPPLQPPAEATPTVTAEIEDLSLFKISQNGRVIAVMPIVSARPGLRGRGTWTILGAIPRPRLATLQEPSAAPTPAPVLFGSTPPAASPTPTPLPSPEYIPSGPNNPVGVVWIDLAKSDSTDPLPYGLHGTSVPDQMKQMDSIGGFRMTNWNITRAVRLLPPGSPLTWGQPAMPLPASAPAAPAAAPAEPAPPAATPATL